MIGFPHLKCDCIRGKETLTSGNLEALSINMIAIAVHHDLRNFSDGWKNRLHEIENAKPSASHWALVLGRYSGPFLKGQVPFLRMSELYQYLEYWQAVCGSRFNPQAFIVDLGKN
jgi:hypothetical protein